MAVANKIRDVIVYIVDWFYPWFSRYLSRETFFYLVCGGGNLVFGLFLYFISFHFILHEQIVDFGFVAVSPHILAFIMSFCVTFPLGFLLNKYITFTQSDLRGHIQLFRYGVTVVTCIILNYLFLKLFVEYFHWYPTISKSIADVIIAIYSYLSQKHYTFRQVEK